MMLRFLAVSSNFQVIYLCHFFPVSELIFFEILPLRLLKKFEVAKLTFFLYNSFMDVFFTDKKDEMPCGRLKLTSKVTARSIETDVQSPPYPTFSASHFSLVIDLS